MYKNFGELFFRCKMKVYTDGGSRGNPGPAATGWYVMSGKDLLHWDYNYLGHQTNNYAEFEAVLEALTFCKKEKFKKINLYSDSKLVVESLEGNWKLKDSVLIDKRDKILGLTEDFQYCYFWHVGREDNQKADFLVNMAFKEWL